MISRRQSTGPLSDSYRQLYTVIDSFVQLLTVLRRMCVTIATIWVMCFELPPMLLAMMKLSLRMGTVLV